MLARRYRLRSSRDISRVFRRGQYAVHGPFFIKSCPNYLSDTRIVIVVSKKVSKKAVVRNRIRRQVSGYFEGIWKTVMPGYDIVITVREDVSEHTSSRREADIVAVLRRNNLLKNEK